MKTSNPSINERLIIISLLFAQLIQMCAMALSPILSEVAKEFPSLAPSQVQMLVSISSIGGVAASVCTGSLSIYVSKKSMLMFGCACTVAAGFLGFFIHDSFPLLLVWSCMLGLGSGIAIPASSAVVRRFVSPKKHETLMGWLVASSNVGAMIMSYFAGFLGQVRWNYTYLIYLIAVPGFIFSLLFLPNDRAVSAQSEGEQAKLSFKSFGPLFKNRRILFCCVLAFLVIFLYNAMPANLSMYIHERSLGGTYEAGIGSTLMLLSGTIGGVIFGRLNKAIGRYTYVLGFSLIFAGQMLCAFSGNIVLVYISCMLSGMSISLIMPQVISDSSAAAGVTLTAAAVAMCAVSNSLGSFSTPLITLLGNLAGGAVSARYIISASLALVTAAACAVLVRRSKKA